jgi:hypothetical protein
MSKLHTLPFETAIIERYRRREIPVEEALVERYLAGGVHQNWAMKSCGRLPLI